MSYKESRGQAPVAVYHGKGMVDESEGEEGYKESRKLENVLKR